MALSWLGCNLRSYKWEDKKDNKKRKKISEIECDGHREKELRAFILTYDSACIQMSNSVILCIYDFDKIKRTENNFMKKIRKPDLI